MFLENFFFSFKDEIFAGTMQIAAIKPDFDKANPRVGVSSMQFSPDNRYMFSRNGIYLPYFLLLLTPFLQTQCQIFYGFGV